MERFGLFRFPSLLYFPRTSSFSRVCWGSGEGRMERGPQLLCAALVLALALAPASAFRNGKWQAEARVTARVRGSLAAGPGPGEASRPATIHAALQGWNRNSHLPGGRNFLSRRRNKEIRPVGLGQEDFKSSGSLLKLVLWLWGFSHHCYKAALPTFPYQHTNYLNNVSSQRQLEWDSLSKIWRLLKVNERFTGRTSWFPCSSPKLFPLVGACKR